MQSSAVGLTTYLLHCLFVVTTQLHLQGDWRPVGVHGEYGEALCLFLSVSWDASGVPG